MSERGDGTGRGAAESASTTRWTAFALAAGVVLFVLAALPVTAEFARYHGDERFYTDAALHMEESGDWLTPRYSDGSERWNKPLAAYWLIGASLRVFGHGPLAARLPFLLAGALVLVFTARAARTLFGDPRAALFAAFALGSSAEFLQLVTRSTPDVLLAAGIAASLAGAAELAFSASPRRAAKWLFFGGAGCAVLAKGALGVGAPLFGLAWIWARHGRRKALGHVHPGAAALFAACVFAAALPPLLRAGEHALGDAFDDQLGTRATQSLSAALANFAVYASNVVRHFLPWSALALGALVCAPARAREWARGRGAELVFVFGWYAVLLAVFSLGNIQRGRYLFPSYPLVAGALAAFVFGTLDAGRGARVLGVCARAFASVVALAACALVWAGWRTGETSAAGGLALAIAAAGALFSWRAAPANAAIAAVFTTCFALPLGERALQRVFDAAPAEALAERLTALGARGDDVLCIGGEAALASQLRLVTARELAPRWSRTLADAEPRGARWLVLAPDAARASTPDGMRAFAAPRAALAREECGFTYPRWRAADVRAVFASDDPRSALLARREPYRIVELVTVDAANGRAAR